MKIKKDFGDKIKKEYTSNNKLLEKKMRERILLE